MRVHLETVGARATAPSCPQPVGRCEATGKSIYRSRTEARRAGEFRLQHTTWQGTTPYFCEHCGCVHLGRKPSSNRTAVR